LVAPRARDLAARDYKRHMKVQCGLSPASVNQALAGMDNLFRFLGLGATIVRREELPRSAPRALDDEQRRLLLQAAEESTGRDRAIVALLLSTGLRLRRPQPFGWRTCVSRHVRAWWSCAPGRAMRIAR
jgi:site-specific recombinase XerD